MNFSEEVKNQIVGVEYKTDGEKKAFMSAFLKCAGSLSLSGGKVGFELLTDNEKNAKTFATYFSEVYGLLPEIGENKGRRRARYFVKYTSDATEILEDLGVVKVDGEGVKINFGIEWNLVADDEAKTAYLRGAFLGGGSVTLPRTDGGSSTGYHLEIVFTGYILATDFCELLSELYFLPKLVERKESYIVYLKTRDEISDLLALMGASRAVLRLAEVSVEKDMNNDYNRKLNCEMSNMSKQIDASVKQICAIERIKETIGLDALPEQLKIVAEARVKYKGSTLTELADKLGLTKSCLNHRLRKIVELSEN